jgi:FkbM family methyltransferase
MKLKAYLKEVENPYIFLLLVNFWNIMHRNKIKCWYLKDLQVFKVTDGKFKRYASVNSRVLSYQKGFDARANYLSLVYFLDHIDFRPGDLVVDCGANMGDLNIFFDRYNYIDYVGYEPNPLDFICLRHNVGTDKCKNLGLWKSSITEKFYVNDKYASSSFIEPPNYTDVINIPAVTLASEYPNRKIKLLKLEAEGAEPEVLYGACAILKNIHYISADVGPERGKLEESTQYEVVEFLSKHGFVIERKNQFRNTILFRNLSYNDNIL